MSSQKPLSFNRKLLQAARAGDDKAQVDLALCFSMGWGVEQNHSLAIKWYLVAAEQDNQAALHSLGLKYLTGEGVEADTQQAVAYWRHAADLDFTLSIFWLGLVYAYGEGLPRDVAEAKIHFERAAKLDYPPAMLEYGKLLWKEATGKRALREAYRWLLLAYEMGFREVGSLLKKIENTLPPETIDRLREEVLAERDRIIAEGIYQPGDYAAADSYDDEDDGVDMDWDDDEEEYGGGAGPSLRPSTGKGTDQATQPQPNRHLRRMPPRGDPAPRKDGEIGFAPPPEDVFSGGDGSSFDQAVVINETRSGFGISAEHHYINLLAQKKGLAWQPGPQRLVHEGGKPYDILTVTWSDGTKEDVYFDIGAFYGK